MNWRAVLGLLLIIVFNVNLASFVYKDFDTCISDRQGRLNVYGRPLNYDMYKKLYERNISLLKNSKRSNITGRIPKIIHIIWLGSDLPSKYKPFVESWSEKNNDWEVILWDDLKVEGIILRNRELYNAANNFGVKSDILRLELLYLYGGVYVDTDMLCIRSIDDLTKLDFFLGLEYEQHLLINNAIIGSTKGNEILKHAIEELSKISTDQVVDVDNKKVIEKAGPIFLSNFFSDDRFNKLFYMQKAVVFPPTYFCPFPFERRMDFIEGRITIRDILHEYCFTESLAVHLWDGSWST